jgi:enoyl-CoA hydratase
MELCLTGEPMSAQEAERAGLVSRVVAQDALMGEAVRVAERIAALSTPVVMLCKESVLAAEQSTLAEGIKMERKIFHTTFGLKDRKEGMAAFAEKRQPKWTHQ